MADITEQQVIEAAQKLGKDEFNRQDIATALGVEKSDVKQAFTSARKAGHFEKVRDDEENTGIFKLSADLTQSDAAATPPAASAPPAAGGAAPTPPADAGEGTVGQPVDN